MRFNFKMNCFFSESRINNIAYLSLTMSYDIYIFATAVKRSRGNVLNAFDNNNTKSYR